MTLGKYSESQTYDQALIEVLALAPIEEESLGAARVAQFVFKPAFHPECAISVIERSEQSEVVVRVALRSVWQHLNQRPGAEVMAPSLVAPGLSVQRVPGTAASTEAYRAALDGLLAPSTQPALALDGMGVDIAIARDSGVVRHQCHSASAAAAARRLMCEAIALARELARWESTQAALINLTEYLMACDV